MRVRRIQRLTQELGVNLAGVEIILRLLDDMEEMRTDMEQQLSDYAAEAERRIAAMFSGSNMPIRKDESLLPVPNVVIRKRSDI
jgi:MerR family transcriptional regulator/heat shock protein HspR